MSGRTEGGDIGRSGSPAGLVAIGLGIAVTGLSASPAFAHASDRGHVLLLPTGHYLAGGALAVAASFAVLALLPRSVLRPAASLRIAIGTVPHWLRIATSLVSSAIFVALLAAGWWGSRDPLSNPLPLTIWTLLWVGVTLAQGVIGNVWRWLDPWYGPWRLVSVAAGVRSRPMPAGLGYWPALASFLAFAWFELVWPAPDDPSILASVAAVYWLATLVLMLIFGQPEWSRRGEFLSAFFGMISRFGIVGMRRGRIELRLPGSGLAKAPVLPFSGVLFLLAVLGSVSFDGLSKTFLWLGANGINPLEYPGRTALMATNGLGLLAATAALAAAYVVAVFIGGRLAGGSVPFRIAAGTLVWSIVPISLAYHFSHYLTVLLVNGQYALVSFSDPFALGWNLFGTAYLSVSAGVVAGSGAAWMLWNAQAAAIVGGHVLAVLVAHGLAARLYPDAGRGALAETPLATLMVAYTVFGLWLLSTPTAG